MILREQLQQCWLQCFYMVECTEMSPSTHTERTDWDTGIKKVLYVITKSDIIVFLAYNVLRKRHCHEYK